MRLYIYLHRPISFNAWSVRKLQNLKQNVQKKHTTHLFVFQIYKRSGNIPT